jgi:ribosome-interacting GTPase 1
MDAIRKEYSDMDFLFISSQTGYNIQLLKDELWKTINKHNAS